MKLELCNNGTVSRTGRKMLTITVLIIAVLIITVSIIAVLIINSGLYQRDYIKDKMKNNTGDNTV